ncbi:hypothetical protein ACTFIW_000136 [Dictyostelium discoideum]
MSSFGKNSSYRETGASLKELGDYLDSKQEGKPTHQKTIGFDTNTSPVSIPTIISPPLGSNNSNYGKSPKSSYDNKQTSPLLSASNNRKNNNNNNNATSPKDSSIVGKNNVNSDLSKVSSSLNELKFEKQPIGSTSSTPTSTPSSTPSSSTPSSTPSTPNTNSQQQQQQQQQQQPKKQQQQQQPKQPQQPKQSKQQATQQDKKDKEQQQQQQDKQDKESNEIKGSKEVAKDGQHGVKQFDDPKQRGKITKKKIIKVGESSRSVQLFNHLPQYNSEFSMGVSVSTDEPNEKYPIHPDIISLGLKYAEFKIAGSNARAIAMMTAFIEIFKDYVAAPDKVYSRELDSLLKRNIQFLVDCRPISISMGNSINYVKHKLSLTNNMSHEGARDYLIKAINEFIERIQMADNAIVKHGCSKINDGDVILTYASSHVVELIIQQAIQDKKKFRLIIVDSRPKHEGRELLHRLVLHGVKITYIMLHAVSYIMKEVTKVFVGAYSVLSNGNLISRSGTSLVASMAKFYNVPFIVCCETYKFTERVQLDSICFNQIGNPQDLVQNLGEKEGSKSLLENWESYSTLKLLNLMYDLTPIELIDMVITEFGMLPPTSIPVVLREYRKEVISIN